MDGGRVINNETTIEVRELHNVRGEVVAVLQCAVGEWSDTHTTTHNYSIRNPTSHRETTLEDVVGRHVTNGLSILEREKYHHISRAFRSDWAVDVNKVDNPHDLFVLLHELGHLEQVIDPRLMGLEEVTALMFSLRESEKVLRGEHRRSLLNLLPDLCRLEMCTPQMGANFLCRAAERDASARAFRWLRTIRDRIGVSLYQKDVFNKEGFDLNTKVDTSHRKHFWWNSSNVATPEIIPGVPSVMPKFGQRVLHFERD